MKNIVVIAHDIRSAHNVGSLLRTAEGLGIQKVYFTGYTPYPKSNNDSRLPHLVQKTHSAIQKTALGAEELVSWERTDDLIMLIENLKADGYIVAALEQDASSVPLPEFEAPDKLAIIIGREVEGVAPEVLEQCSVIIEIPMQGRKESYNVAQAAAMALYHCRFVKR